MSITKTGAVNPQIVYGEDVIRRITYANNHADGAQTLQVRLVEALNSLLTDLCAEARAMSGQVMDVVLVGNTSVHHCDCSRRCHARLKTRVFRTLTIILLRLLLRPG